ncbi:MAG TPA: cardiolipin synthase [Sedimentibacter sp.]|nr:cardiolipin synthase [Sedimentibacter sp.]HOK49945.1 cardiolipin synthase [Sedimentibacter sp.]HOW23494.1 cardiolipin synthase [Sedimentibacter sp.]HRC81659.1 cardiolipin synthase [Sedimentibacter sp.]
MEKFISFLVSRATLVSLALLAQIVTLALMVWRFSSYFFIFDIIFMVISVLVVLYILNRKSDPTYKIAWVIPIMLFPVFGGLFYLMFGGAKLSNRTKEELHVITDKLKEGLYQHPVTLNNLRSENTIAFNQAKYIEEYSSCPVYDNSPSKFLPSGEEFFKSLTEELKKAEKFIFLEFFIIQEGVMWNTILDILKEKAKEGLDVRVVYDDFGCVTRLPHKYNKKLESYGIKCAVFNPYIPILNFRLNNRNHRKIVVIDGKVGYTGGVNLADEYINAVEKFGHWRDSMVEIRGDAVWSLTVMFLSMWNHLKKNDEDYSKFRPIDYDQSEECHGYVQPFDDSPLDNEHVSESVYLNLINQAERYIYIETPYLIIDNKMMVALTMAAKRGVDVRILTPHIPDKWYAFAVTQSNYEDLIEAGVSIYQYTPGFNHGKTFVVDDEYAVVGTINLDFRSLYLHFECGVWMYNTDTVHQVKESTMEALKVSRRIEMEDLRNTPRVKKYVRAILKIFAPLM